jgi:membrane-bound serine protease (ClpP class)
MDMRFWAILCCALMVVAVFVELLTPSMGAWTLAALSMSAASIYLGFRSSEPFGYAMVAANVALFPLALWAGITFLKRSPLILDSDMSGGVQNAPDALPLAHLLGKSGQTVTPLRPAGTVMLDDQRVDVITEGKFVESGVPVKVIRVEGMRVVVEPV